MQKRKVIVKIVPILGIMLFSIGCAMPIMNLRHESNIGKTYTTKGNLQVQKFSDLRQEDEKILQQTVMNTLTPQIWSGNTSPETMEFFQKTIETEAANSKLFTLGNGEFVLSGNVTSLKVDRVCTIFRYIGGIFDFPTLTATVVYDVTLTYKGKVVLTRQISHTKTCKYWSMTETSFKNVSNKACRLLDNTVTESIGILFEGIYCAVLGNE